jgi:hypothetical protein
LVGEAVVPPSSPVAADGLGLQGFRLPAEIIVPAVRWYLRYRLSYQDVEELLVERGVEVDYATVYRWVQRFTPLLADTPTEVRLEYQGRRCRRVAGIHRRRARSMSTRGPRIGVPSRSSNCAAHPPWQEAGVPSA